MVVGSAAVSNIDLNNGQIQELAALDLDFGAVSTVVDADCTQAAVSAKDSIVLTWRFGAGSQQRIIEQHDSPPVLGRDGAGRILVSADPAGVVVRDWASGEELRRFAGPGKPAQSLALGRDSFQLAIGLERGQMWIADTQTGFQEFRHLSTTQSPRSDNRRCHRWRNGGAPEINDE